MPRLDLGVFKPLAMGLIYFDYSNFSSGSEFADGWLLQLPSAFPSLGNLTLGLSVLKGVAQLVQACQGNLQAHITLRLGSPAHEVGLQELLEVCAATTQDGPVFDMVMCVDPIQKQKCGASQKQISMYS